MCLDRRLSERQGANALSQPLFRVVDEATSPIEPTEAGLVASSTTENPDIWRDTTLAADE